MTIGHQNDPPTSIGPYWVIGEQPLGEGGMGVVWEVADAAGRSWALKLAKEDVTAADQRMAIEFELTSLLSHPDILGFHDHGSVGNRPYVVMELLPDGNLEQWLQQQGDLPTSERYFLWRRIAEAVAHAHQQEVLHRDLKPSNILMRSREGRADPLVADWGQAGLLPLEDSHTQVRGTAGWAAPELAIGLSDERTDVYGLAALLLWLLTGQTPLDTATDPLLLLPPAGSGEKSPLYPILHHALGRHADRPATVEELRTRVQDAVIECGIVDDMRVVLDDEDEDVVPPDPTWAVAAGRDERGPWADLEIAGVRLRCRWIPPHGAQDAHLPRLPSDLGSEPLGSWFDDDQEGAADRRQSGFWMSLVPVYRRFWRAVVLGIDLWAKDSPVKDRLDRPLDPEVNIDFPDCQRFIGKLMRALQSRPHWDPRQRPDLPTAREWLIAAADLHQSRERRLDRIAWHRLNSGGWLHRVALRSANAHGLYDLYGNVHEWCQDRIRMTRQQDDGPLQWFDRPCFQAACGGSFRSSADLFESGALLAFPPDTKRDDLGFRIVFRA
jgi:serine/threonine protein kinase